MKYTIISEKVGVVGEEFVPGDGINIEALLTHGFIESDEIVNDMPTPKSAKTKAPAKKD
jgi:hypothetical protein